MTQRAPAQPSEQRAPVPAAEETRAPLRASVHALGCRLNLAEAELLRRRLRDEGYTLVDWGQPADVQVLNSCTVTAQADAKSRQTLRAARRLSPESTVAVTGCHAQLHASELAAQGLADLIVGNNDKLQLPRLLRDVGRSASTDEGATAGSAAAPIDGAPPLVLAPLASAPLVVTGRISREPFTHGRFDPATLETGGGTRAHLKIQDGCDFVCSFCVIPRARGGSRPRTLDDLLNEARVLAASGVREIVLTGVNLGAWVGARYNPHGASPSPTGSAQNLTGVVDALNALEGAARIRISSIEPTTVDEGLLERMADPAHKLAPHLHLPLQSGSSRILRAMRRRYTAAQYAAFAERALARVPGLCLGTDVLVGFPGEDDAAFGETVALLTALSFAYAHVFPFSERPGTLAARRAAHKANGLPEAGSAVVPASVRTRRAALLRALSESKRTAYHRRFLGQTVPVLFEHSSTEGSARGYTDNYMRVEVACEHAETLRNRLLPVRLLEAGSATLTGEIVADEAVQGEFATGRSAAGAGPAQGSTGDSSRG